MRAVTIEQFPGLDLRADPGDDRGAVDLMNVTIEPGRIRSRDGTSSWYGALAGSAVFMQTHLRDSAGSERLIVADTTTVYAFNANPTLVASSAATSYVRGGSVAMIGTPTLTYLYYCAAARSPAVLRRWDGVSWTSPALAGIVADVVGVSPTDNRLVVSDRNAGKLWFSDPGAPETFGANNYVSVVPGDGETIRGMTVFNNQLFVFKQTKFFVFYGNSGNPAAPGTPLFNYRTVDTGVGMSSPAPQTVCTGRDGVYFIGADGIYRTTGGPPVKMSHRVDPFFTGVGLSPFWTNAGSGSKAWAGQSDDGLGGGGLDRLYWFNDRLYALLNTSANNRLFVWDSTLDVWTVWSNDYRSMASFIRSTNRGDRETLHAGTTGTAIHKFDPTLATDAGSAIASYYRLPFESYGDPGEKRIRETLLEGVGAPTLQLSKDWGAMSTGSAVTLGASPALAVGRQRNAMRGRRFSLQIGASSGAWSANRVQVNLGDASRPAGVAR